MRCRKKIPLVKAIQVSINILGIALCTQHNYWYIQQNNAIPIFPFRKSDTDGPIRKPHTNFWYCPFNFIYLYMRLCFFWYMQLCWYGWANPDQTYELIHPYQFYGITKLKKRCSAGCIYNYTRCTKAIPIWYVKLIV